MKERNFIAELAEPVGPAWDHVLLLTYDFEPRPFFENDLMPLIQLQPNGSLTVVTDMQIYEDLMKEAHGADRPRFAGVRYNFEAVRLKNGMKFHPKFYLFLSDSVLRLSLGSANLTGSGFKRNLETLITITLTKDTARTAAALQLLFDIRSFLADCFGDKGIRKGHIECSRNIISTVNRILSTHWFQTLNLPAAPSVPTLIFSTQGSMLDQAVSIAGHGIKKIEALSPFFDVEGKAIDRLFGICPDVKIYVPKHESTFPTECWEKKWPGERITSIQCSGLGRPRFIHSKLYRFTCKKAVYSFVTSSNCTRAGLGINGPNNVEVGLILREEEDAFFSGPGINFEDTLSNDLVLAQRTPGLKESKSATEIQMGLHSALFLDDRIIIDLEEQFSRVADLSIFDVQFSCGEKLPLYKDGDTLSTSIPGEFDAEQSLFAYLSPRTHGNLPTNAVVVSRPHLNWQPLPVLGRTMYDECMKMGGAEGVLKAMGYAKQFGGNDWLIYLLTNWDLAAIYLAAGKDKADVQNEDDVVPNIRFVRRKPLGPADLNKLQRNLALYHSDETLTRRLFEFLNELANAFSGTAPLEEQDRALSAAMPICIGTLVHFQNQLDAQQKIHKKEWPYYRYLHVLKLADHSMYGIANFLKEMSACIRRENERLEKENPVLLIKCEAALHSWSVALKDGFAADIETNNSLSFRTIFRPRADIVETIEEHICTYSDEALARCQDIFWLHSMFSLDCPFMKLLA